MANRWAAPQLTPSFIHARGQLVDVDGVYNFRDLGGHLVDNGLNATTRKDFIFRSGHLTNVSHEGLKSISVLGITTIFDLRSAGEAAVPQELRRQQQGVISPERVLPAAMKVVSLPMVSGKFTLAGAMEKYDRDGTGAAECIAEEYFKLATSESGVAALRTILMFIHENPESPMIIHCSLGKDRTGVVCAIILALAGVSDTAIEQDYSVSKTGLISARPELIAILQQRRPTLSEQECACYVERVITANAECIRMLLGKLRSHFGCINNYITTTCGISRQVVDEIWNNLVRV